MEVTPMTFYNSSEVAERVFTMPLMRYVMYTIGALGLFGNAFVIVVIASGRSMRGQMTNIYIVNQSFVDASSSLVLILSTIFEDDGRPLGGGDGGLLAEIYCRFWMSKSLLWGLFTSSTYNLLLLTFERYLAIVHPIWHKTKLTRRMMIASVTIAWSFGLSYNVALSMSVSGLTAQGQCTTYSIWPNVVTQRVVGVLTISIQFFMPLSLLVFFYAKMIVVLRRRVAPTTTGSGVSDENKKDSMAGARKNILKTLAMVACAFVLCWVWNQVYFLLFNLGLDIDFTSPFYNFTVVMVLINCCINPFIYVTKYKQFQHRVKHLLFNKSEIMDNSSVI